MLISLAALQVVQVGPEAQRLPLASAQTQPLKTSSQSRAACSRGNTGAWGPLRIQMPTQASVPPEIIHFTWVLGFWKRDLVNPYFSISFVTKGCKRKHNNEKGKLLLKSIHNYYEEWNILLPLNQY